MAIAILKIPSILPVKQQRQRLLRYLPVWAVLFLGISSSCGSAYTLHRWEKAKIQEQYARSADTLALTLQQNLDRAIKLAKASTGLYLASETVDREEFARFSRLFLADSPEIVNMGLARPVKASDRAAYESEQGQKIWERAPDNPENRVPAGDRAEYYPNTYLEPLEQQAYLHYNRAAQWQSAGAIARARDTATLSATSRLPLESGSGLGFVLYSPIYRNDAPADSVSQRREAFLGVSFITFQINAIVKASLRGFNANALDLYVYEMPVDHLESALQKGLNTPRDRFLAAYNALEQNYVARPDKLAQQFEQFDFANLCPYGQNASNCLRTVNFQGQEWSLLIIPTANFAEPNWRSWGVLAIGFLCTAGLTFYLRTSLQRASQQERLVKALTNSENLLKKQKEELKNSLKQLQQAQLQLIHSEKMSSLGQLVAGIAHEINNPVNFIYGNLHYTVQYSQELFDLIELYQQHYPQPVAEIADEVAAIELDYVREDLPKILHSMEIGAERIREIVSSMRNFARKDELQIKPTDIHSGIDSTLMILRHRLKEQVKRPEIAVIKEYSPQPLVNCNAGQLNQVFMNLLANAIDALEQAWFEEKLQEPPKIWIQTQKLDNTFLIRIADNGTGIPPEIQQQLFDPFFTTKSVGKGTGLGLSICYSIVVDFHKGKLSCESAPGEGARFTIEIPCDLLKES